jgi:hypothetical protein
LIAMIEFELHAFSQDGGPNYSAIRDAIVAIDIVVAARATAPRGRGASSVTSTWQDEERKLLTGKLGLPGSQSTLERARLRQGRSRPK